MQFAISPNTGNEFLITSISFYLWVNSGGGMRANVYYSTDPTFTTKTQVGSTITLTNSTPGSPNVSASPNITAHDGETFYLRVYPWYTSSTTGKHVITKIVTVSGSTTGVSTQITTSPSSLLGFSQTVGTPSATQTYSVSGHGLTNNVIVTPPTGFEISTDAGSTWNNNSSPITLTISGDSITGQPVTVTVRINAVSGGTYSGDITHASIGATTANVTISGFALASEPTTQSSITFNTVTGNSIVINFSGGNGSNRIVVARMKYCSVMDTDRWKCCRRCE